MLTTLNVLQLIIERVHKAAAFANENYVRKESTAPVVLSMAECGDIIEALSALVDFAEPGPEGLTAGDFIRALSAVPANTPVGKLNRDDEFERYYELPRLYRSPDENEDTIVVGG